LPFFWVLGLMADEATPLRRGRVVVEGEVFKLDGQEVVLLGGNVVFKAQPWFPPEEVTRTIAKDMADGAAAMAFKPSPASDGTARAVVPCVRLGVSLDGAFPSASSAIDFDYASRLEMAIKTYQAAGVFVFLDIHQDACATTNGGEGIPWWVTQGFQQTAGCCFEQCCCCCCFSGSCWSCCPEYFRTSYITTPTHPLRPFCSLPSCLMNLCGLGIDTWDGDPDPWLPFSLNDPTTNPSYMNAGNASMRRNNADGTWSRLITTAQVQNSMPRIYASRHHEGDRVLFFEPYMMLVKHLCRLWDKYENVVAVELFNEPPLGGLPNLCSFLTTWRQIEGFLGDVLEELDKDPAIKCPLAIQHWSGTVPGESTFVSLLACAGTPSNAMKYYRSFAERNRLILSFHHYSPPSNVSWKKMVELAKEDAQKLGGVPIWLSEYWEETAQAKADKLAVSTDLGCPATTYWHFADVSYTGTNGWYKYPESVLSAGGEPVDDSGNINDKSWSAYAKTVADGSFWGAQITGAAGASEEVLKLVPATSKMELAAEVRAWPPECKTVLHKARRKNQEVKVNV